MFWSAPSSLRMVAISTSPRSATSIRGETSFTYCGLVGVYVWLHVCVVVSYLISVYVNQDTRLGESVVHYYMHVDFQSARVHTQSWQLRLILGSFFCRSDNAVSRSQFLMAANNSHWKFEENHCEISHAYPTPHTPPYDYHNCACIYSTTVEPWHIGDISCFVLNREFVLLWRFSMYYILGPQAMSFVERFIIL